MTDADWLGLLCRTESGQGHEWPYLAWTVRNRVRVGLAHFGGETYSGVIRKPWQFSAFNATKDMADGDAFVATFERYPHDQLAPAIACAQWVLSLPDSACPFAPDVYYFFSLRSMRPPGRLPGWATHMERFTPPGVDPWRWIFARERR